MKISVTYTESFGNKSATMTIENEYYEYAVAMREKEHLWKLVRDEVQLQLGLKPDQARK
jgi:hypothetical protein